MFRSGTIEYLCPDSRSATTFPKPIETNIPLVKLLVEAKSPKTGVRPVRAFSVAQVGQP